MPSISIAGWPQPPSLAAQSQSDGLACGSSVISDCGMVLFAESIGDFLSIAPDALADRLARFDCDLYCLHEIRLLTLTCTFHGIALNLN
jgi:hypothetical protein